MRFTKEKRESELKKFDGCVGGGEIKKEIESK